jgi:hypothetical protein
MIDHFVRGQSLVADIPPRARVLLVSLDANDPIRLGVHLDGEPTARLTVPARRVNDSFHILFHDAGSVGDRFER